MNETAVDRIHDEYFTGVDFIRYPIEEQCIPITQEVWIGNIRVERQCDFGTANKLKLPHDRPLHNGETHSVLKNRQSQSGGTDGRGFRSDKERIAPSKWISSRIQDASLDNLRSRASQQRCPRSVGRRSTKSGTRRGFKCIKDVLRNADSGWVDSRWASTNGKPALQAVTHVAKGQSMEMNAMAYAITPN